MFSVAGCNNGYNNSHAGDLKLHRSGWRRATGATNRDSKVQFGNSGVYGQPDRRSLVNGESNERQPTGQPDGPRQSNQFDREDIQFIHQLNDYRHCHTGNHSCDAGRDSCALNALFERNNIEFHSIAGRSSSIADADLVYGRAADLVYGDFRSDLACGYHAQRGWRAGCC